MSEHAADLILGLVEIAQTAAVLAAIGFTLLVTATGQTRAFPGPYRIALRIMQAGFALAFVGWSVLWLTGALD